MKPTITAPPLNPAQELSPLKRALLAIEELQTKVENFEQQRQEPLAVIGMGCRIPGGADDPDSFWHLLREGRSGVGEIPAERWNMEEYFDSNPDAPGKIATKFGGFLKKVDRFEPQFFGISPREAVSMDPQQRLLLEVSWEALENAAQSPARLAQTRTGVYFGVCSSDYAQLLLDQEEPALLDMYYASGIARSIASGRISYILGLQGPSLTVDTACSSSLVAVHLACQALRNRECRLVLAGGVNVILSPKVFSTLSHGRMLAADGRCKAFDAAAQGFVRAEGCGVIVLKRLSDAVTDQDRILAVIRGSALNNDGPSSGLTAPNGPAQESVIRAALANGGVSAHEVSYIETHGTGTPLGDPIEAQALGAVFGPGRDASSPLWIGSLKTNVGHLEGAAGVVGLIKTVLALQHREIPPHLHFEKPSPHIPWKQLPLNVPVKLQEWTPQRGKRIAGVSSFGFSGTNAHVVLEEAPTVSPQPTVGFERPLHLLTLSARTDAALKILAERYASCLEEKQAASSNRFVGDFCYTANAGRAHLGRRLSIVGANAVELGQKLRQCLSGQTPPGVARGDRESVEPPRIAFLFTGQGSQYVGMGRQLYQSCPTFARALNHCDAALRDTLGRSLLGVIFPQSGETSPLNQTQFTQPALFALEYALSELWRSWGVQPAFVLGHSVGEYVAACLAGVFSVEDGLKLIAERGRLMQALPPGGRMAAVMAPAELVRQALGPAAACVSIAALNGPRQTVISGVGPQVAALLAQLAAAGIKAQELTVSHAFHSPLMEPMLAPFEQAAGRVLFNAPRLRLVSNVTGRVATAAELTQAGYWRRHVRESVQFASSMQTLAAAGCTAYLEIGPNPVLLGLGRGCVDPKNALWLASLRGGRDDWSQMLESLGQLYASGVEVDWAGFDRDYPRRKLALPTYPFQRERFWPRPKVKAAPPATETPTRALHPLNARRVVSPSLADIVFESRLSAASPGFVKDHRVFGTLIFPATGYLEAVRAAAALGMAGGEWFIEDMAIGEALALGDDQEKSFQVVLSPEGECVARFKIFSGEIGRETPDGWRLHASGNLRRETRVECSERCDLSALQLGAEEMTAEAFYQGYERRGLDFGLRFRGVRRVWCRAGAALGLIEAPAEVVEEMAEYGLHPALLDACIQVFGAAKNGLEGVDHDTTLFVPLGVESFRFLGPAAPRLWSEAVLDPTATLADQTIKGHIRVTDDSGRLVAELRMSFKRTDRAALERATQKRIDDWLYEIAWSPLGQTTTSASVGARRWLIFADRGGVGQKLARHLSRLGDSCSLVYACGTDQKTAGGAEMLDPSSSDGFTSVIKGHVGGDAGSLHGIIYLWPLDAPAAENLAEIEMAQQGVCGGALHLVQALARYSGATPPRLWLCTRGAQRVVEDDLAPAPLAATLWGLGKVIALEDPELRCVRVDLAPEGCSDETEVLVAALDADDHEDEVALRAGRRWGARLKRLSTGTNSTPPLGLGSLTTAGEAFHLGIASRGSLENLRIEPARRHAPGPGEVEIRMRAAALNFRDVLNVMGLYPGDPGPLGAECAGEIVSVGEGVTEFAVGDPVVGLAKDCFAAHITTRAQWVVRKPPQLSFEEAITIPVAFLTAHFTLNHIAKLRAGERVLIHAAAGGVGLAAVALAQSVGAEIFATAGSPEKRDLLKRMGVAHVMDSRSLAFADEIMRLTQGKGVDVVLNSLADQFVDRSFEVISTGGRFLEIGKRGIWDTERVNRLGRNIRYFIVDWGQEAQSNPSLIGSMLWELMARFDRCELKPLPHRTFEFREFKQAFRFMAQARHVGKVVLAAPERSVARADFPTAVNSQSTYLITGGLGGMGLMTAKWLVERGARHLVLAGRRAPTVEALDAVRGMETKGAQVRVARLDVSDAVGLSKLLADIRGAMPPLRGVIHAAGVLDDGMLVQQTWERFARVFAPKVTGSLLLDRLTVGDPLDFFVMFSSIAAIFGSPGQGNHAAANAFMDSLAALRRAEGRPCLSVNWGAWGGAGVAVTHGVLSRAHEMGHGVIDPPSGFRALELLLQQPRSQAVVAPVDWPRFQPHFLRDGCLWPLLTEVARPGTQNRAIGGVLRGGETPTEDAGAAGTSPKPSLKERLAAAAPNRRRELVIQQIRRDAARVLGVEDLESLPNKQPLHELGLDSLMAVELRNTIGVSFGQSLPATLLFDYPTVEALTGYLCQSVPGLEISTRPDRLSAAAPSAADLVDQIDRLDDAEIDRLLKESGAQNI